MEMERSIEIVTKKLLRSCEGENSSVVVGACLNIIQTCMNYGDAKFQRACSESLRAMANIQLNAIGKPRH